MSDKIRMICEGDLECPNQVELTKEEVIELNKKRKSILCDDCKPKYGHLSRDKNLELGWSDL